MPTAIDIRGVSKTYRSGGQTTVALDGVSLTIEPGELFFLLGPSGCGKTTLLRVIAGFIEPSAGQVLFDGRDVTRLAPNRRNTGMVFQSYALWPHMTVAANVGFGLGVRRVAAAEREARVSEALRAVQMGDYAKRKPNQLSGGQQQRVALARALVVRPDVLLLDEPLSNLDARLRIELRREIRTICKHYQGGLSAIYVTHDQREALSMADRIGLMKDGRIDQVGSPEDLYHRPRSRFAAEFLGDVNLLDCRSVKRSGGRVWAECELGPVEGEEPAGSGELVVAIRPEAIQLNAAPIPRLGAPATVKSRTFLGDSTQLELALGSGATLRSVCAAPAPAVGSQVVISVHPDQVSLLAAH